MTILFANSNELKDWTKENYFRALGQVASKLRLAECIPTLLPWGPSIALGQSIGNSSIFFPTNEDANAVVSAEGDITHAGLKIAYGDYFRMLGVNQTESFHQLGEAITNRVFEADLLDSAAVWMTFNPDLPRKGKNAECFARYCNKGSGAILDLNTGVFTIVKPVVKVVPKLTFVDGDIFDAEWTHLVHCANAYHTMGGGIARVIKEKYPQAYAEDCKTVADESKLGTFSIADIGNDKFVVNLYGQSGIGCDGLPINRNARYDAIYNGLYLLYEQLKNEGENQTVAIPHGMASALAGGDWNIVEAIITSIFSRFQINTVVVRKIS